MKNSVFRTAGIFYLLIVIMPVLAFSETESTSSPSESGQQMKLGQQAFHEDKQAVNQEMRSAHQAARETKQAVDASVRASKQEARAQSRATRDANRASRRGARRK